MRTVSQSHHRLLSAWLALVAFAVSGVPVTIVLGSWLWAGAACGLGVLVAAALGDPSPADAPRPSLRTALQAMATVPLWPVLSALFSLTALGLAHLVVILCQSLFGVGWSPTGVAAAAGIVVGVFTVGIAAAVITTDLVGDLVRADATVPAGYEVAASSRPTGPVMFGVEVAVVAAAAALNLVLPEFGTQIGLGALGVLLVLTGAMLLKLPVASQRRPAVSAAEDACRAILTEAGFEITERPRVDDVAVDGVLGEVDVLAERDDRAFAIRFIDAGTDGGDVSWRTAPELIVAAQALTQRAGATDGFTVEPLLVLVGGRPDDSLRRLESSGSVRIVELPDGGEVVDPSKFLELVGPPRPDAATRQPEVSP